MEDLGKGLAIAACAFAIALVAVMLKEPQCLWAFIPVAWIASDWRIRNKREKDKDDG